MEKGRPHYKLDDVKAVVMAKGVRAFTYTAVSGFSAMGLESADAIAVVLGLTSAMFYKSMTTYVDHRVWQDVYHAPCPNGKTAYIKLTMKEGNVVIQFKER